MNFKKFVFFVFVVLGLSSCSKVKDFIPIEIDKTLGEQFDNQLSEQSIHGSVLPRTSNPEIYSYLDSIKSRIIASPDLKNRSNFAWQLKIINNDSVLNAFCVAGGYIYVYTGLIKFLDNEAELAGVLAHEIAHADNRHSTGQLASQISISLLISLFVGNDMSWLINIGRELVGLSFSRSDEQEADFYAVKYLSSTEYDARGVGGFFKKMIKLNKDAKVPEFLSTHPASENRLEEINSNWKKLGGKQGKLFELEYQKAKNLLK